MVGILLFYLFCISVFDEMAIDIHLPVGNLNMANLDISLKDVSADNKHDIEAQYAQRMTMPLSR